MSAFFKTTETVEPGFRLRSGNLQVGVRVLGPGGLQWGRGGAGTRSQPVAPEHDLCLPSAPHVNVSKRLS